VCIYHISISYTSIHQLTSIWVLLTIWLFMDICVYSFIWMHLFISLSDLPRSRIPESHMTLCLYFRRRTNLFQRSCNVFFFTCSVRGIQFPHVFASACYYYSSVASPPPGDLPDPRKERRSLNCRQIPYCLSHQGSP